MQEVACCTDCQECTYAVEVKRNALLDFFFRKKYKCIFFKKKHVAVFADKCEYFECKARKVGNVFCNNCLGGRFF